MRPTPPSTGKLDGMTRPEILILIALGLLSFWLAVAFPAHPLDVVSSCDATVHFQAQQLFRCDPRELDESQLDDVKRWCRCLRLAVRHAESGVRSLDDEESRFVLDTFDEFCPDRDELAGYRRIYDSCQRRLSDGMAPVFAAAEWPATLTRSVSEGRDATYFAQSSRHAPCAVAASPEDLRCSFWLALLGGFAGASDLGATSRRP